MTDPHRCVVEHPDRLSIADGVADVRVAADAFDGQARRSPDGAVAIGPGIDADDISGRRDARCRGRRLEGARRSDFEDPRCTLARRTGNRQQQRDGKRSSHQILPAPGV